MMTVFKGWVGWRINRVFVLLLVMVWGILLTQACSGDGGSAETDRAAMVALFHSTNGTVAEQFLPPYLHIPFDQWETDPSIQLWRTSIQEGDTLLDRWETFLENIDVFTGHENWIGGIKTDGRGRITVLEIGARGFGAYWYNGEIPPELGNLSKLEVLDLLGGIRGEIPPELGNLNNLKELRLNSDGYGLTGEIPPELGNLRRLEVLHLHGGFTGEIPSELGNLRRLEVLHLHGGFTGEIPSELGNLRRLEVLQLHGRFTGEIPPELGDLDNLESLSLYSNRLAGCKPHTWRSITDRYTYRLNLPFCEEP